MAERLRYLDDAKALGLGSLASFYDSKSGVINPERMKELTANAKELERKWPNVLMNGIWAELPQRFARLANPLPGDREGLEALVKVVTENMQYARRLNSSILSGPAPWFPSKITVVDIHSLF